VARAPREGSYLDTLGWAYYHQGDLEAAVQNLKRAIELKTEPTFYYHLAVVYRDQGKRELAKEKAREALQLRVSFPEAEECRSLLETLENHGSGP